MAGKRTLIAYATKGGVTGENAELIAGVLRDEFGHEVDVVDLRRERAPDIAPYDNVVVGAGVRIQRYYGRIKRVLKDRRMSGKRVAIFLSSGEAGEDPDRATRKYVGRITTRYTHLSPVAARAFGGRMPMGKKEDWTDPERVREWAHELGDKLGQPASVV